MYNRKNEFSTIICNSGKWAGYEDIPTDYPSKMAHECSSRTERDDTVKPGRLYTHLEDFDDDEALQEKNSPVLSMKLNHGK